MSINYIPGNNKIGMRNEENRRCGKTTGTQFAPKPLGVADVLAFDYIEGDFDVPEPYQVKEEFNAIGHSYNVGDLIEKQYEVVEADLPIRLQTAIFLRYFMGGYAITAGTSYSTPKTSTTTTTGSESSITSAADISSGVTVPGDVLKYTHSGVTYYVPIKSISTTTITLYSDITVTSEDAIEILKAPFKRQLTEADTSPSFILHSEQTNSTSEDIIREGLGILVKKIVVTIENTSDVKCAVTILVPKVITENEAVEADRPVKQTSFPTPLTCGIFRWDHLVREGKADLPFVFTYASTAIDATFNNDVEKWEITMERDIEYTVVPGDPWPYKVKYGKRDYSIKCSWTPTNKTLLELRQTELKNYTNELALSLALRRDSTADPASGASVDYIQWVFNSLYVADYPNKLISVQDSKEVLIDFELKNAPKKGNVDQGVCVINTGDNLDERYYSSYVAS